MAAIWKGTISFGLVAIPVELRSAVRADHISFRLLHESDKSPVKYERISQKTGKTVPWDEIVKGYEYTKGKFVVLTDEDFKAAALAKSKTIDILDFVQASDIDPRYFETPYFLVPTKGGEKAYALLREAITKREVIGIGKIILRQSQHLIGIKAVDDALVLEIMRFENEILSADDIDFPKAGIVRPQEVHMAEQLVENLVTTFDPSRYTDEYRANLMKVIKAKMKGKEIEVPEETDESDVKVLDLMERLKASLGTASEAQKGPAKKGTAKKASSKKTSASAKRATKKAAKRKSA